MLPGGAAPAARAQAVGALLDDLAAAWRRYQHTLDCKRKAAQLSCVQCSPRANGGVVCVLPAAGNCVQDGVLRIVFLIGQGLVTLVLLASGV